MQDAIRKHRFTPVRKYDVQVQLYQLAQIFRSAHGLELKVMQKRDTVFAKTKAGELNYGELANALEKVSFILSNHDFDLQSLFKTALDPDLRMTGEVKGAFLKQKDRLDSPENQDELLRERLEMFPNELFIK